MSMWNYLIHVFMRLWRCRTGLDMLKKDSLSCAKNQSLVTQLISSHWLTKQSSICLFFPLWLHLDAFWFVWHGNRLITLYKCWCYLKWNMVFWGAVITRNHKMAGSNTFQIQTWLAAASYLVPYCSIFVNITKITLDNAGIFVYINKWTQWCK